MFVRRIGLVDFRNFSNLGCDFEDGLNYIEGENAVGKTNLIEAIYYLSLTRSFKKNDDRDLIRYGCKNASLGLNYISKDGEHSIRIEILERGKIVYFDDEKQKTVTSIIGKLPVVVFEPSSTMLFKGDPLSRRKLVDETLSNLSSDYLYALARFKKFIKERNVALAQRYDEDVIDILTKEVCRESFKVYRLRNRFVSKLNSLLTEIYDELFDSAEKLRISYLTNVPLIENEKEFVEAMMSKFDELKSEERMKCVTLIGCHRDDFRAYLDDKNVASYGSQGQNRLVTLALKLAIGKIYEESFGEKPVYLLDDVLSDLDEKRVNNLLNYLKDRGQVFVTSAKKIEGEDKKIYEIKDSSIERK